MIEVLSMTKVCLTIGALLFLTACTTPEVQWAKDDATVEQARQDKARCELMAEQTVQPMPQTSDYKLDYADPWSAMGSGFGHGFADGVMRHQQVSKIHELCMEMNGY